MLPARGTCEENVLCERQQGTMEDEKLRYRKKLLKGCLKYVGSNKL